ncbi:anaerobic ribonucleoside-triphosphate reductase [Propionivibrio limicola]|uniref:anaerobic ribonucleoside-triphosphate reductase n=1 Tax=Propionivibrio limicola TaxID=167645 RepID=UPI001FEB15C3|nr:anaerobic ribonucleoside-triphosphate reductase [Propionivibrio limicola]
MNAMNENLASLLPEHERQRCEVWTRVMGYHRPVTEFNLGKQCEHRERQHFSEPDCFARGD